MVKKVNAKTRVLPAKHRPASMKELLEQYDFEIKSFKRGQLVEGIVVSNEPSQILLDVGAKSEGIIRGDDLLDTDNTHKTLKPGDKILVNVVQPEDRYGYLVLSLKKAERERKWRNFETMYKNKTAFDVKVLDYSKGGLLVDALGQRGFIPISHLDRVHFADFSKAMATGSNAEKKANLGGLRGNTIKVVIIEVDRSINRLVLSEKDAVSDDKKAKDAAMLNTFKVGEILEGAVSGIMPYGLFVEISRDSVKVDGLVHISEISWEKVEDPSKYHKVGDKVKVRVVEIDEEEGRVQLSLKALKDNPWIDFAKRHPIGSKVKGVVTKVVPFGAFVSVVAGRKGKEYSLDGLVHISETSGVLKEGDEVETVVTICDVERQKLGLSVRRIEDIKIYK